MFGFSPISLHAAEWEQKQNMFILNDTEREVSCTISHPRQQAHLYRVTVFFVEMDRHQQQTALVLYRHEQFTLLEGATSYEVFRSQCGLPDTYRKWFP